MLHGKSTRAFLIHGLLTVVLADSGHQQPGISVANEMSHQAACHSYLCCFCSNTLLVPHVEIQMVGVVESHNTNAPLMSTTD